MNNMDFDHYIAVAWPSILLGVLSGCLAEWITRDFVGRQGAIIVGASIAVLVGGAVGKVQARRAEKALEKYQSERQKWSE